MILNTLKWLRYYLKTGNYEELKLETLWLYCQLLKKET